MQLVMTSIHVRCWITLVFFWHSATTGCSQTETCGSDHSLSVCGMSDDNVRHQRRLNIYKDENGEYFSLKFDRKFGVDTPLQRPLEFTPWQKDDEFASAVAALERDGAVALKGAVEPSLVSEFRHKLEKLLTHDEVVTRINAMQLQNITGAFYNIEQPFRGVRIRKTTQGRYEYRSMDRRGGGELVKELQIPEFVEPLLLPPVVKRLLSSSMSIPWRMMNAGILTALPGASAQDWHRDIAAGLFGESLDIALPDYLFTAIMPLEIVTREQGSELVLRSHKIVTADLDPQKDVERVAAFGDPGDVVLFNGKVIHRGLPNPTNATRSLLYMVYAAEWFEAGRDQGKEHWTNL